MSRRCVAVWIPAETVMALLGNWRHATFVSLPWLERAADQNGNRVDLPPDYEVIGATYDFSRRAVGVMLAHHSFNEVPDGEFVPSLYFREVTLEVLRMKNPGTGESDPGPLIVEAP